MYSFERGIRINDTSASVMSLKKNEIDKVRNAFINIKNSIAIDGIGMKRPGIW